MYNQPIEEKQSWEHAGIVFSGDFSSSKRTKEMANKGKEAVASLMCAGIRPGGLNPICGAEIWKSVGLARMLYGSQLWWNMTKTDLETLERVNRLAAKRMQGLCLTTKSEAAIGNLGLWTIEGYIDKIKLFFLQKLVSTSQDFFHKQIFIWRLFKYLYTGSNCTQGFIKDILKILTKYNLEEHLLSYIETAHFPTELTWKSIVNKAISTQQIHNWRAGIATKPELEYYGLIHQDLKPLGCGP